MEGENRVKTGGRGSGARDQVNRRISNKECRRKVNEHRTSNVQYQMLNGKR